MFCFDIMNIMIATFGGIILAKPKSVSRGIVLAKPKNNTGFVKLSLSKDFSRHWRLYSLALPALVFLGLFNYWPMFGLVLAFKDFKFKKGILGSDWMSPLFDNFQILISSSHAFNAMKNTILLNLLFIAMGTIAALTLAILLNEVSNKYFKKISQSLTLLPHFISWIVVGTFLTAILSYENGVINRSLVSLGFEKINFYSSPQHWPAILAVEAIWKRVGYNSVIYLAAITGLSASYYEAARIDGATRVQMIFRITLPLLRPTVIILTLLALGRIMNSDFGMFWHSTKNLYSLWPTTDVIDTFIYRGLRLTGDLGISAAAGFFQSFVSLFIVLTFNWLAKKS
jgi:putative aldouronate transport system permease protein